MRSGWVPGGEDHGGHAGGLTPTESPGDPKQGRYETSYATQKIPSGNTNLEKCGLLRLGSFLGGGVNIHGLGRSDITRVLLSPGSETFFARSEFPNQGSHPGPRVRRGS